MFTTGSKLFFGLSAAAAAAGLVYWVGTDLEFFGVIVLFSLSAVAASTPPGTDTNHYTTRMLRRW